MTNDFSRAACEAADQRLAKQLGTRTLIGGLEATDHSGFRGDQKALLRLYDDSIKYWRELVESEGRTEFAPKLAEVLANREAAANPPKAKPELKAKTKPKAKPKAKPRRAKKA